MRKNKVLLSVINWNNNAATNACLAGIAALPAARQPDVRLIDNDSRREAFDPNKKILAKLRSVEVIRNAENLGFGGGHNQSLEYALSKNYDYAVILNNDVELIEPGVFDKLVAALQDNERAIASAPTILSDKKGIVWYAGGDLNRRTSTTAHRRVRQDSPAPVSFLSGCCMVIDLAKLREAQTLLPEEFFMYWEDADWCAQVTKKGYELLYVPDATILHNVSSSLGQRSPAYAYYIIRNNILFIKRNTPVIWKPLGYFTVFLTAAKYEVHALRGGWKHFVAIEKALLSGWQDGLLKRTGRRKDPS